MNLFKFIKGSFTNKRKSKMRNKTKRLRKSKSKRRRMSKRMKGGWGGAPVINTNTSTGVMTGGWGPPPN